MQQPLPTTLSRSLRYYSWYAGISGAYFWMPVFVIGGSFAVLAAAQALLATGFACASGTDTSLHYALLAALRREQEYSAREARLAARTRVITAAAAITGGVCAWIGEYRLAYALSLGAAVYSLVLVTLIVDTEFSLVRKRTIAPLRQLRAVVDALRTPPLGYLFAFVVAMTALNHVPYEFYQLSVRAFIDSLTHERAALQRDHAAVHRVST